MISAEQEPRGVTYDLPKLIFDESVLDDELPYKVSANMEEFGAFLFQHGMKPERIGDLSVRFQSTVDHYHKFSAIWTHGYGEYNISTRTIHIATDWAQDEYDATVEEMQEVSQGEQIMLQESTRRKFNEVLIHEAKHAIDSQDVTFPTRSEKVRSTLKTIGTTLAISVGSGITVGGSVMGLVEIDAPTVLILIPPVTAMAGIFGYMLMKITRKSEWDKEHENVFAFQKKHKDHMRWRSISALKPNKT